MKKIPLNKKQAELERADSIIDENICPECKSRDIGYEKEERYCRKCGYVLD